MRPVRFVALIGLVAFLVHTPSSSNSLSNVSSINEPAKTYETGPECAPCSLNSTVNSVGNGAASNSVTATLATTLLAQFSQQAIAVRKSRRSVALATTLLAQFSQQGPKLVGTGAQGGAGTQQGSSVFLSADGNTAIVGGGNDRSGVLFFRGAAWVWTKTGGVWTQQGSKLVGSGAEGSAHQGDSVSLSADGNTAIVGGLLDGLFGSSPVLHGAAWVWKRSGGVWTEQGTKLVASDAVGDSLQGDSVSLSADGNTAIVGGSGDNSNAGAAWVWTRSGGVWTQQGTKLVASDAMGNAHQGSSVSLSADGNTAIVGGFQDNSGAGAAWVWTRSGGVWTQQGTKLVGSGVVGIAAQGSSVSLSADGNTAIVGGSDDSANAGAAWVWTRSGGVWTQQGTKLVASDAVGNAHQGSSVSLSADGNTAIVGGFSDFSNAGATWVWTRSGGVWTQQGTKLVGSGAVGNAHQGSSVSLSADGNTAIVGGPADNSLAGAAWVFTASQCGTGSFGTKTDFGTGSQPTSVAVGDFNGDGMLDLAVANGFSATVSILLGTGTGSFGVKTDFGTGNTPQSVAVGDFNGDGKLDLATANGFSSNTVSILLGTGTGSFGTNTDFGTGTGSASLAVGDFNGDGKLDLAVANLSSATVSILLGTGTGSFGAKTDFSAGLQPSSVAVGDFNDDGRLDLAVVNAATSQFVSILLGTGTGSFGANTAFGTGSAPVSVAVGDFNGDGNLDLAVANQVNTVSILLGTGTGSFGAKTDFGAGGQPLSVASADFNGDGKLDLAVANLNSASVSILPGTGTGSFGARTALGTGSSPHSVAVGDFNGDGKLDLAVANASLVGTVSILLNTCGNLLASAGTDQATRVGTLVTLDGSGSASPSAATYTWTIASRPNGSLSTLSNPNTLSPTFTPDREGFYTIQLTVSAGGLSSSDTIVVQAVAVNCNSSSLSIYPVALTIGRNQNTTIRGFGGSSNYTWSLVTNNSGGSVASGPSPTAIYVSGNNIGQDVIRLTDQWCGTRTLAVNVVGSPPEVTEINARPNPTQGASTITVTANFPVNVTQAEYCIDPNPDNPPSAGNCSPMIVLGGNRSAFAMITTSTLSLGFHNIFVRGRNIDGWGSLHTGYRVSVSALPTAILLLHGYDKDLPGPHPEDWKPFAINQIQNDFPLPNAQVFVVNLLNSWGTIEENVNALELYIATTPAVRNADNYILIGHSMGGLISRAYAAEHRGGKVKAIVTLDTPHKGSSSAFLRLIAQAAHGDLDKAIKYVLTPQASEIFNGRYLAEKSPRTNIYAIASQTPDVPGARPFDGVVDVTSQWGVSSIANNIFLKGTYKNRAINPFSTLHSAILGEQSRWNDIYTRFIKPILRDELGITQGSSSISKGLSSSLAFVNPQLPPLYPSQKVKQESGTLSVSAPNAVVNFVTEAGRDLAVSLVSNNVNPDLTLNGPGGIVYTASTVNGLSSSYEVIQNATGIIQAFLIHNPPQGNWTLNINAPNSGGGPNLASAGASWNASIEIISPISMKVGLPELNYLSGETLKIKATLKNDSMNLTGLTVNASIVPISGGGTTTFPLFDDGAHDDGASGDGVYGGNQSLNTTGSFFLSVTASGTSGLGSFQRQQIDSISVGVPETTISGAFVESAPDVDNNGRFDSISWSFPINVPRAGSYTVLGQLAASDGTIISSANSTATALSGGTVNITLDFLGKDIYRGGKSGPFTLKNLRVTVADANGERMTGRPPETAITSGPYWSWLSFERDEATTFIWKSPVLEQVTRGGNFDLSWNIQDGNGATTIDLYYDLIGSGFEGTPLVMGIEATNGDMSYTWNMNSLPDGVYYVYSRVRNGEFSNAVYGGSVRKLTDTDGDGMPDAWETSKGLNPNSDSDAYLDPDGDLLSNLDEYLNDTNPNVADTDSGGEKDGSEVLNDRNPLVGGDDVAGITILFVSPAEGDSRGGDKVVVQGSAFQSGATATFGGTPAPNVTFINSTQLIVTTPAQSVGTVNVTVNNPAGAGSATQTNAFTFLHHFIEPPVAGSNGPICAGSTLNLVCSALAGATYSWTGPNGFASSLQNPSIGSAMASAAGVYSVTVTAEGHTYPAATTVVSIDSTSLSSTSQSFSSAGGTGAVSVLGGNACTWTAVSNDSWITITSGGIGSGNGTVSYSIVANGGAGRTGTMTIAGRTFTVTQSAMGGLGIDSVTPLAGRASGGQLVKLTGSFANLSSVMIGGVSASFIFSSGTIEVTVTTPPHAVGAVSIDLTPTSGSVFSKSNAFAYLPTVFTDDTLLAGITMAKAQHIIELRGAVDALRAVAGLGPAPWTDSALLPFSISIKAIHILELRSYLEDAAGRLGYPAGSYTEPGLTGGFLIKRVHIEELRQRIRTIAG